METKNCCMSILLVLILLSCKKEKVTLSTNIKQRIDVNYYSDSIIIDTRDALNKEVGQITKYLKIDGEYFGISYLNINDKYLFFSTCRDTVYVRNEFIKYEIHIEKVNENLYRTTQFSINNFGRKDWKSEFYYDKNYKITKIRCAETIEYISK